MGDLHNLQPSAVAVVYWKWKDIFDIFALKKQKSQNKKLKKLQSTGYATQLDQQEKKLVFQLLVKTWDIQQKFTHFTHTRPRVSQNTTPAALPTMAPNIGLSSIKKQNRRVGIWKQVYLNECKK